MLEKLRRLFCPRGADRDSMVYGAHSATSVRRRLQERYAIFREAILKEDAAVALIAKATGCPKEDVRILIDEDTDD